MPLPGLIGTSLILILASVSKGEKWAIDVQRNINVTWGSNVTIRCNLSYPENFNTMTVKVFWKTKNKEDESMCMEMPDKNAFIYHSDESCVLERYRGKTKFIGEKKNCSLLIQNVTAAVKDIYVRIRVGNESYSFYKQTVSIFINDGNFVNTTTTPGPRPKSHSSNIIYYSIFLPIAALAVIVFAVGIFCLVRHKRSQAFTREESGYYANFSRASSDPAKSEESNNKKDKKLPEPKALVEPVYINVEAPAAQMDQSVDQADSIYVNVNYSK
ncbi:uncharacterized protein LOC125016484 [Mugil cephalus]|uniref:uncharacterized protein LOC125016484 n=1 Tax=Mugil cephalus TaxID=48193 RepID=UPI001FB7B70F|nr:uncharacterized protein LOC125016484 [Mugil cephalus]